MKTAMESFGLQTLSFPGSEVEQASFLLRTVKPLGNVDPNLAALPAVLRGALEGTAPKPSVHKIALRQHVAKLGLDEAKNLGGKLDKPLSTAGGKTALYFVIHDTSSPTLKFGQQFPANINEASWPGNDLSHSVNTTDPVAHMFINRAGESRTGHDYGSAKLATKLETGKGLGNTLVGRFIHNEMVQPRILNSHNVDEFAPKPGFSKAQLARLALLYTCASVRGDRWLIPAFHCVLDQGIKNGHDDPQNFSLADWCQEFSDLLTLLGGGVVNVAAAPANAAQP